MKPKCPYDIIYPYSIIWFGKYKGRLAYEIALENKSYILWLIEKEFKVHPKVLDPDTITGNEMMLPNQNFLNE